MVPLPGLLCSPKMSTASPFMCSSRFVLKLQSRARSPTSKRPGSRGEGWPAAAAAAAAAIRGAATQEVWHGPRQHGLDQGPDDNAGEGGSGPCSSVGGAVLRREQFAQRLAQVLVLLGRPLGLTAVLVRDAGDAEELGEGLQQFREALFQALRQALHGRGVFQKHEEGHVEEAPDTDELPDELEGDKAPVRKASVDILREGLPQLTAFRKQIPKCTKAFWRLPLPAALRVQAPREACPRREPPRLCGDNVCLDQQTEVGSQSLGVLPIATPLRPRETIHETILLRGDVPAPQLLARGDVGVIVKLTR
mmetsp:Transcript_25937/g.72958  ORF Transcript_25937/g.72958 Transcript_25937/m.72958 type:complete len:307 (+) Transcript_25937:295-1215(+)